MHIGYLWTLIGLLFLLIEIGTPGLFFFISFAAGSFSASITAFLSYDLNIQCVIALITSLSTFIVIKKYIINKKHQKLLTNVDAIIGLSGIVIVEIKPKKPGVVKINGELWRAKTPNSTVLVQNSIITVQAIKGNTIIAVKKT